jgi:hypothetical protein
MITRAQIDTVIAALQQVLTEAEHEVDGAVSQR